MPELIPVPLSFEKGLADRHPSTMLLEGEAAELQGWEPLAGGLVPQAGWKHPTQTSTASSKRGRGITSRFYVAGVRKIVVATYDNAGNILLKHAPATPEAGGAWTSIETVAITSPYHKLPVAFAAGAGQLLYSNPGFPTERIRKYDGTTAAAIATDDIAGRALAYHLNRFWEIGDVTNPTYLRFTEIGDEDNWNTSENFIPVGQDDGEPGEDIVVFDRGLVIGKRHSLWWLGGYGPDSFQLMPISQMQGTWPGRGLVVTPVGIVFPSMSGEVLLWDGADVRSISGGRQIIAADGGDDEYVSCRFINDRVYIAYSDATDTRKLQVYDIRKGISWERHHQDSDGNGPRDLEALDHYLLATPYNAAETIQYMSLQEIGKLDTATWRDPSPDAADGTAYVATTPVLYPAEGAEKATLRSVYIQYRQWEASDTEGFTVTPYVDGAAVSAQAKIFGKKTSAGVYVERKDFGANISGTNIQLRLTSSPSSSESAYSIETGVAYINVGEGRR